MKPYFDDPWLTVYAGDCRAVLETLPSESVHCVVTSPPYWGLRDYGTASWIGGDEGCDHKPEFQPRSERPNVTGAGIGKTGYAGQEPTYRDTCGKCGATRQDSQLGLESTPEQYVESMVAVFREVRRVLRKDGTLWLNLGDSYASGSSGERDAGFNARYFGRPDDPAAKQGASSQRRPAVPGLKPKDLVGIPWRVAFALQADGWYLRSDIIWAKPNPMPESVTDRPTKSHEYLFLLSKSERYFFDSDAVRETGTTGAWGAMPPIGGVKHVDGNGAGHVKSGTYTGNTPPSDGNRNVRSVWTIATQPYPGAHFATFPPKLVEPCIKAGSSERGVCPECGAPWRRVVERVPVPRDLTAHRGVSDWAVGATTRNDIDLTRSGQEAARWKVANPDRDLGWQPSCAHDADPIPATILDIFAGSGTVGMVAQQLSRRALLIDLNASYLLQCLERNRQIPLGMAG